MTRMLSGADLAREMQVSRQRVGQWLSSGKLDGCYSGEGAARRFDLDKTAAALGRNLDQGQLMGNGAATRLALKTIEARPKTLDLDEAQGDDEDEDVARRPSAKPNRDGGELGAKDPDRYELARTQKAEEEARKLRRQNAEAEGTFVLASEVERQVAKLLAQEIAEVEAMLRDGSQKVADQLGVDIDVVEQIFRDQWRNQRAKRTAVLREQAEAASPTANELVEDI